MKMKLFGKTNKKKDGSCMIALEEEVNNWLQRNQSVKIVKILQSSNGGSWAVSKIFLTVWYEEAA